jgi:hypothetical protein
MGDYVTLIHQNKNKLKIKTLAANLFPVIVRKKGWPQTI